jgi:hypothetical protein
VWVITYMPTFARLLKHGGPDRWWPAGSPYGDVPGDHLVGVDVYNRNMCHDREWRPFLELVDPTVGPRKQPFTAYRFSLGKERRLFIGGAAVSRATNAAARGCTGRTRPTGTRRCSRPCRGGARSKRCATRRLRVRGRRLPDRRPRGPGVIQAVATTLTSPAEPSSRSHQIENARCSPSARTR